MLSIGLYPDNHPDLHADIADIHNGVADSCPVAEVVGNYQAVGVVGNYQAVGVADSCLVVVVVEMADNYPAVEVVNSCPAVEVAGNRPAVEMADSPVMVVDSQVELLMVGVESVMRTKVVEAIQFVAWTGVPAALVCLKAVRV